MKYYKNCEILLPSMNSIIFKLNKCDHNFLLLFFKFNYRSYDELNYVYYTIGNLC